MWVYILGAICPKKSNGYGSAVQEIAVHVDREHAAEVGPSAAPLPTKRMEIRPARNSYLIATLFDPATTRIQPSTCGKTWAATVKSSGGK